MIASSSFRGVAQRRAGNLFTDRHYGIRDGRALLGFRDDGPGETILGTLKLKIPEV